MRLQTTQLLRRTAPPEVRFSTPYSHTCNAMTSTLLLPTDPPPNEPHGVITESDAVDIWIARWLRVRRIEILRRYDCDPRRLYEIWEGRRFPESRERARKVFESRYPELIDRIDFGNHRVIPRSNNAPGQLNLFD